MLSQPGLPGMAVCISDTQKAKTGRTIDWQHTEIPS